MIKVCELCGQEFTTASNSQRICRRQECQETHRAIIAERRREHKKKKRKVKGLVPPRKCAMCGVEFNPYQTNQVICGSYECRKAWKRHYEAEQRKNKELPEKQCGVCGTTFQAKSVNQKFCSEKCRRYRAKQLQNQRRGHAEPMLIHHPAKRIEQTVDPLYGKGQRWCGVPVESTSFAPLR